MFRHVLSLVLVPPVLLAQYASVGHAHSDGQPNGHDLRPHVHARPLAHRHGDHDHEHDDRRGSGHARGDRGAEVPTAGAPELLTDHDADAHYLSSTDMAPASGATAHAPLAFVLWVAPLRAAPLAGGNHLPIEQPRPAHPPPRLGCCATYIQFLTLLI